jgi:hypothetical protein
MFQRGTHLPPLPPYLPSQWRTNSSGLSARSGSAIKKINQYLNPGLRVTILVFCLKVLQLVVRPFICLGWSNPAELRPFRQNLRRIL